MARPKLKRPLTILITVAAVSLLSVFAAGCMASAPTPTVQSNDCAAALAYLAAHEAPGFVSYCPHYAGGNAAETVIPPQPVNNPGVVSGVIYINDTNCAVAYENEAANSHGHFVPDVDGDGNYQWVWPALFDPYGLCTT